MTDEFRSVSRRLPTQRHDNKLILNCQRCEHRALVDVKPNDTTDWICPACLTVNRVSSEVHDRKDWMQELARKAGLRN